MGPLVSSLQLSGEWNLLFAFFLGLAFGFVLEQAGFSSSRKLAGMFYGYDATVLKVFFTAAITTMIGLYYFNFAGILDLDQIFVNHYYLGATIVGGVIMGAGFIIGGFCPGTSVCAAAIGKIDAMFFLLGGLLGAFIFAEGYPLWQDFHKADYLGQLKLSEALGLSDGLFVFIVIVMAVGMFWMAEKAEKMFARPEITKEL